MFRQQVIAFYEELVSFLLRQAHQANAIFLLVCKRTSIAILSFQPRSRVFELKSRPNLSQSSPPTQKNWGFIWSSSTLKINLLLVSATTSSAASKESLIQLLVYPFFPTIFDWKFGIEVIRESVRILILVVGVCETTSLIFRAKRNGWVVWRVVGNEKSGSLERKPDHL